MIKFISLIGGRTELFWYVMVVNRKLFWFDQILPFKKRAFPLGLDEAQSVSLLRCPVFDVLKPPPVELAAAAALGAVASGRRRDMYATSQPSLLSQLL